MRGWLILLAACVAVFLADLGSGRIWLAPADLWQVARHGPVAEMWILVWELRLPRILTALGAGAAFGMAGAVCQSLFRNPLAAPEMLGVTAGASAPATAWRTSSAPSPSRASSRSLPGRRPRERA